MADAFEYLKQTQRFLREQKQEFLNPDDLMTYINRARREVAGRTQCIRRLTPISGQIVDANISAGGSGYTAPVVVITTPDWASGTLPSPNGRQATAVAQQQGGVITDITIEDGGDGYFQPVITITDPTGTGASILPVLSPINTLNEGQEVYNFSDIYLGNWPGVSSVFAVKSVSIIYSQYRYSIPVIAFSVYQAQVRQFSTATYQYVPSFGSQFGQGTNGSFFFYPPASQQYQVEYDCFCLPTDLLVDNSIPEAIPLPWTDAVPYMAAQLAYQEIQNFNAAKFYEDQFDRMTLGYSQHARVGRAINPYGRP